VSFWLVPRRCDRNAFQTLINALAHRYDTVPFIPHVTLYSGPCSVSPTLDAWLDQAVQGIPPFELDIDGLRYSHQFSKTLFVQLRPNDTLHRLATRLRQVLPHLTAYDFDPHLSLIYKALNEATQQTLVETLALPIATIGFDEVQAVGSPESFQTQADVKSLHCLYTKSLHSR
jgi:putative hydrolase of the HAD superfamily